MEILLLIVAATYAISGKHQKDTSVAAYKAGKEPPGLVKARMRHEAGGGRFATSPGKDRTPKGPGATRLLLASRWAGACEKAKTRGEDKLKRWQAWYQEQAPERDEQWREKQRRKMQRRTERLEKWQDRWTNAKTADSSTQDTDESLSETPIQPDQPDESPSTGGQTTDPSEEAQAQPDTESESEHADRVVTSDDNPEGAAQPQNPQENASTAGGSTSTADTATTASIGELMDYQQGAATLNNHADEVDGYDTALSGLGQDMESVGWGAEVHGPLSDMHTKLQNVSARYRDLAENVKHQGDSVNDAYDDAPWAPDRAALTQ